MGDSLSIVFTIILASIVMFFFPMIDSWERQDDLAYMAAYTATVDFVDSVRNTGVLTKEMYNSYITQIYGTGNSFDVTLEHRQYKIVPSGPNASQVIYLNNYTNNIENVLFDSAGTGKYIFNKGDYFYVSIKNTNKTQSTMIKQTIYGTTIDTFTLAVPYGGQIKSNGIS